MANTYDVFLEGEVVDLCVPNSTNVVIEQWYRWFNDQEVTKYLHQGYFPNTIEKQRKYYENLIENDNRIALLIKPKTKDYYVGIASLSCVDFRQRQCGFALVIGKNDGTPESMFYAMEAKCRMTEHAFETVGMERINSGQVIDLIKWQRWQILFGYQIEGVFRKYFRKGDKTYDAIMSACLIEDYRKIKDIRNGVLWPGKSKLFELLKLLPKVSMIDNMQEWLCREREEIWKSTIFDIT